MVAILFLALWVPVTMHCTLESLPGFNFLQCCCDDSDAPAAPGDCDDDFCAEVESGSYRMEENPTVSTDSVRILAVAHWIGAAVAPVDVAPGIRPHSPAPTELRTGWQFTCRTALPPRPPSCIA
jgi:hypothetical protein